jgi:hypothetical protein
MNSSGDQQLPYSTISGQSEIQRQNTAACAHIAAGCSEYTGSVKKGGWDNVDFETSLGAVSINYSLIDSVGNILFIYACINDDYDFHAKATVPFPLFEYY